MRFITEFELNRDAPEEIIDACKGLYCFDMGNMIADSFEWRIKGQGPRDNYALEIEAFPMDKWIEFKEKLLNELYKDGRFDGYKTRCLINELESFGKPAGAAKEPGSI